MGEQQRKELATAMRDHERKVAELQQALARIRRMPAPGVREQTLYLTAQVTRHQISLALIACRLDEAAPADQ